MGMTKADLLARRRVFVVVEGEHDRIILDSLFKAELLRAFAQVFVLRGAKQAIAAAHAEWLLAATDAPLLIVFDKLSDGVVQTTWEQVWGLLGQGQVDEALVAVRSLISRK